VIAAYLRESTNKQDISTQRKFLQEYCATEGVTYHEFADDGYSGTFPFRDRPQESRLLAEAEAGRVKEVVVYMYDRVGRDHADTHATIGLLLSRGVKLRSLKEGPIENTPSGKFVSGIHSLVAEYERSVTLDRSYDAMLKSVQSGLWVGGMVPYGYRQSVKGKPGPLVKATERIPGCRVSEVEVIERIYAWADEGRSCIWIADTLNSMTIPTAYKRDNRVVEGIPTSGLWTSTRVRNLILQPIYKGVYVWGRRKFVRDSQNPQRRVLRMNPRDRWHEVACPQWAIVSPELWDRAIRAVHQNRIAAMAEGKAESQYLLRGIIRCTCGLCYYGATTARMTTKRQPNGQRVRIPSGATATYYMHSRRSPRERCTTAALRGEHLEQAIWSDIEVFLAKPGAVIQQLEEQLESQAKRGRKVVDEIKSLENQLASHALKRRRAQDFLVDGTLERAEYDRQVSRIHAATTKIEAELSGLRPLAATDDANAEALAQARSVLDDYRKKSRGKLTFTQRRAIVEALADVTVTPRPGREPEVRVRYRFLPHAERFRDSFTENFMGEHRCRKRRRSES
jgi:site-specific DNA recombinase